MAWHFNANNRDWWMENKDLIVVKSWLEEDDENNSLASSSKISDTEESFQC